MKQKGFTLVELLVVVAIIGVLSALVMANLVGIRQRARDAQRKSDVRQIQSALELYRADLGSYPNTTGYTACSTIALTNNGWVSDTTNLTVYLKSVPCDPSGSGAYNNGVYYYTSSGSTYTLGACIENASDTDKNVTSTNPGGSGTCTSAKYFVVTNP